MTVPGGQWLDEGPERWACRGRSAVDRGPEPGQWRQNLVLLARQAGPQGVGEQGHGGPNRGHPRTGSETRKLLGALAAHVNDLDRS